MIGKLISKLVNSFLIQLSIRMHDLRHEIARKTLPGFANTPKNLFIDLPRRISNPDRITIGDNVTLGPGVLLSANTHYPTNRMRCPEYDQTTQTFEPRIVIGNRVTATADLQLSASTEIIIEDDVMFATNVHINDASHGYDTANQPYKCQPLTNIAPIRIARGCWIGQNAVISSGVTIGEYTIIGANTIVNRDIPPRCIAVGSPVKIIKTWQEKRQCWMEETR